MATVSRVSRVVGTAQVPLYRLVYLNSRGAGELTRYLLAFVEAPYDDIRYPLGVSAQGFGVGNSSNNPQQETNPFLDHKKAGHFDANLGKLPLLQVLTPDAKAAVATLGQSHAINRFLAQRHGCFGEEDDILERTQIDGFYESIRDMRSSYLRSKRNSNRLQWLDQELPVWCQKLEKSMPPTKIKEQPWLIGKEASLADIALYSLLGTSMSMTTGSLVSGLDDFDAKDSYRTACPRLLNSVQALADNESIQWWERTRPDTFS